MRGSSSVVAFVAARRLARTLAVNSRRVEDTPVSLKERFTKALRKKADRGFSGYPVQTLAFYGPDDKIATKVAVGIVLAKDEEPAFLERWFSQDRDMRNKRDVNEQILKFIRSHEVKSVAMPDRSHWVSSPRRGSTILKIQRARSARFGRTVTVGPVRLCGEEVDAQPRAQPDPPMRSSFSVVASVAAGRLA